MFLKVEIQIEEQFLVGREMGFVDFCYLVSNLFLVSE